MLRGGTVPPGYFVRRAQREIDEQDRVINAVSVRFEQPEVVFGRSARPFSGVPLLVKDALCGVNGEVRTEGTRWLRRIGYRDNYDSVMISRLREAGFGLLGRTNVPEFAASDTTEPVAAGPTRNPHDVSKSAGGSSGGSAAAVAAGYVAAAHGTDASGSIRLPASWCGVVGMKPSRGLVPNTPDFGQAWGPLGFRSCHGVLARSVTDVAAVLDVMSGGTAAGARPAPGYLAALDEDLPVVTVAVARSEEDWDQGVVAAVGLVADVLQAHGCAVTMIDVPRPGDVPQGPLAGDGAGAEMAGLIDWWRARLGSDPLPDDLEPVTWEMVRQGESTSARELLATMDWLETAGRHVASWCAQSELLITPTTIDGARPLGRYPGDGSLAALLAELETTTRYTDPFSVSGQPCISVPVGRTASGMPCGVQLAAPHGHDGLVLRTARHLENSLGFDAAGPPQDWR
jgi:amidase